MSTHEREFRIQPGRISSGVVRAHSTFGRGRISFSRERLFAPARHVMVKVRSARHKDSAFRSAPLATHLAHRKRHGVTRNGVRIFDAAGDQTGEAGFEARGRGDRHHCRSSSRPRTRPTWWT